MDSATLSGEALLQMTRRKTRKANRSAGGPTRRRVVLATVWLEHAHLGRSVAAEIARLRIEEACELLGTTRLPVGTIAETCGYSDAKELRRALRRALGHTPWEYRRTSARPGVPSSII